MIRLAILFIVLAVPAFAEAVFAARTIPARTMISPDDLVIRDAAVPGAIADPSLAIGQETRVTLYAGRPVRAAEIGPPAVVERNEIIPMVYENDVLTIATEGRAMERAGPGDLIRVMNLSSRNTVTAMIGPNGTAYVSQ